MGLLEKARYYRMGFREKAKYWLKKWGMDATPAVTETAPEETDPESQTTLDRKIHDMNTLFEIGKEINSSLDIDVLLEIILLTCMGQMGLNHIAILTAQDEESDFKLSGQRGLDEINPDEVVISRDNAFINDCEENEELVRITELSEKPAAVQLQPLFEKLKTALIVPMIAKGEINGLLVLGKKMNAGEYTKEDEDFLQMLASMASIAVHNAMLYTNLFKANQELDKNFREFSTLYEISKIINSSDELEEVLKLALETMSTGFGVECASICLYDEHENLTIAASIGLDQETKEKFVIPKENPTFELIMETGEPEVLTQFKSMGDIEMLFSETDFKKIDYFLSLPLISSEQKLGVLNIHVVNHGEGIDNEEKDRQLFSLFASQIAPPILATRMLEKGATKKLDLFSPLVEKLEGEISLANDFDIPLTFILLRIQGAQNFEDEENGIETIMGMLTEKMAEGQNVYRFGKNRLLLAMPNVAQEESFEFINSITTEIRSSIKWVTLEFSNVIYPVDGKSARELLFKIE